MALSQLLLLTLESRKLSSITTGERVYQLPVPGTPSASPSAPFGRLQDLKYYVVASFPSIVCMVLTLTMDWFGQRSAISQCLGTVRNKLFEPLFARLNPTTLPTVRNILKMSWYVTKLRTYSSASVPFNSTVNPSVKARTSTMKIYLHKELAAKMYKIRSKVDTKMSKFYDGNIPWSPLI